MTFTYDMPNLPDLPDGWHWEVEGDISDQAFSQVIFKIVGPTGKRIEVAFVDRPWAEKNETTVEEFVSELSEMALSRIEKFEAYEAERNKQHNEKEARVRKFQDILAYLRNPRDVTKTL